jgi:hypothetical protein
MDPYSPENLLRTEINLRTIVIPASVTILTRDFFVDAQCVESVHFEAGSQVCGLQSGTFDACRSLRWICIAASVEFINSYCFSLRRDSGPHSFSCLSRLETVTFEPGSRLRKIERDAFYACNSLRHLYIPASVEEMERDSLPPSPNCLEIDPGNRSFRMRDGLVVRLSDHSVIRYYGAASEVAVPDEIEAIHGLCFAWCQSIRVVRFGPSSKLSSIRSNGFSLCEQLETIQIPSSVALVDSGSFCHCLSLRAVSFCSGSRLDQIHDEAFCNCPSLESIVLPPSVRKLGCHSFAKCRKLATSPLPFDSELVTICAFAFDACLSLRSIFLPSSVEFVGAQCFRGCHSLLSLTFSSPSHLQKLLDLPPNLSGFVSIPDSVEVLLLPGDLDAAPKWILTFGPQSSLREIVKPKPRSRPSRSFLQVSTRSLKVFRRTLEWEGTQKVYVLGPHTSGRRYM